MASSGNFMTFNNLAYQNSYSASYSELDTGNLRGNASAGGWGWPSNFSFDSGKWYCEFYIYRRSGSSIGYVAVVDHYYPHIDAKYNDNRHRQPTVADYTVRYSGEGGVGGVATTTGISNNQIGGGSESQTFTNDVWQDGDVIAIALDLDSSPQTVQFYRNGSAKGTAENLNSSASGTWAFWAGSHNQTWFTMNAGQDSTFAGNKTAGGNADENGFGDFSYSPPSGFLAPCSANLPTSDNIDPAQTDDDYPGKQFNAVTYTGNGGSQSIDCGMAPDLVWVKNRDGANSNLIFDTTRGATKTLFSDNTNAESTAYSSIFGGFTSTGFDLDSADAGMNNSSVNYVAWCWRANGGTTTTNTDGATSNTLQANVKAGFSISQFSNSSGATTIGHGLGVAPSMYVIKIASGGGGSWGVYHKSIGATKYVRWNSNAAATTGSNYFNDTEPTSTVLSVGSTWTGTTIMCYAWADVEGFQKFGRYDGNGSNDGPFIYTGFRPRYWFFKEIDAADDWVAYDTARDTANTGSSKVLRYENSTAEFDNAARAVDVLSNGLKIKTSNGTINTSGNTYIFGAWADIPAKYNNAF